MNAAQTNRPPEKVIPPEVLRRWQDMVRRAVASKQPIGPMVQQFAEHAFNRRVANVNVQAQRGRDLAALRRAIMNEIEDVERVLTSIASSKSDVLPKPFQGYIFELKGRPEKETQKVAKMASTPIARASEDHAHKATSMENKFVERRQLQKYVDVLKAQATNIKTEQDTLEAAISKSMESRESLVGELTQMAWALYKVAEQIIEEMNPANKGELLNESTMARYRPDARPQAIGSEEATTTMAATSPAQIAALHKSAQQGFKTQEVQQAMKTQDVQLMQSVIFNLATERAKSFVTETITPGAAKVSSSAGKAASSIFSAIGRGVVATWREVLRRVINVLAKPRTP